MTKLFGVNYETHCNSEVTSPSSWLPCSNSEGTMESCELERCIEENTALVPSYSEAVLIGDALAPPRLVYYARPLDSPSDSLPAESPPPYQEALGLPPLARLRRSLTERGELRAALLPRSSSVRQTRPRTVISMETSL